MTKRCKLPETLPMLSRLYSDPDGRGERAYWAKLNRRVIVQHTKEVRDEATRNRREWDFRVMHDYPGQRAIRTRAGGAP